jgi:hypothetical protein
MSAELFNVLASFGIIAAGEIVIFGIAYVAMKKLGLLP